MRILIFAAAVCAASGANAQIKSVTDPSAYKPDGAQTTAKPVAVSPAPLIVAQPVTPTPGAAMTLPPNTEITLRMNDELNSKSARQGTMFYMSVVEDVRYQNYVVIPRGTRGVGEVTWRTGKGAFGKSAKMEMELRYIQLGGRNIPITGKFRQEGEGNTVATVGAVIAVGIFAGFVTGRSAVGPQGRELKGYTNEAITFAAAAPAPAAIQTTIVGSAH